MNIELYLKILCGVFWIITYLLIIAKSFKDKTYGMPFFAIYLNLAWEFTFCFIYPPENFLIARIIFLIWLILDLVILCIFFKYGYKEFKCKDLIGKKFFYTFSIISIIFSTIFMILSVNDFASLYQNSIEQASGFIANLQNLLMSILFVSMLLYRGNTKGQSVLIGIFKWVGTLTIAILKFSKALPSTTTELFIIVLIQIFDILYIYLMYKTLKNPCKTIKS